MTHALKVWRVFYPAIVDGSKTFELRKDDRPYKLGDTLILQEYNETANTYTGMEENFTITFILRDCQMFGLKEGYCILGMKPKGLDY